LADRTDAIRFSIVGKPEVVQKTGFQELPKWIWVTQPLIALEQADPFGVMTIQNGPNLDYAGN
jgi:hypothetical protein